MNDPDKKNRYVAPEKEEDIKIVDNETYLSVFEELIKQGRTVRIPVSGGSMTPFLIHRRDCVFLSPADSPLKKGDVVMYTRESGQYVLHRIVRVRKDGLFDICGDAQQDIERGVKRENIFARADAIERKGKLIYPKSLFWWFFAKVWCRVIPLRHCLMKLYRSLAGIKSKIARTDI